MTAALYLADQIVDRVLSARPCDRERVRRIVAGWIAVVESRGAETIATDEGWTPCCDGTGEVRSCSCQGCACPHGTVPCPDCKGPTT